MTAGEELSLHKAFNRWGRTIASFLAVQIVAVAMWIATMEARMGHAERHLDNLDNRVHAMEVDDR